MLDPFVLLEKCVNVHACATCGMPCVLHCVANAIFIDCECDRVEVSEACYDCGNCEFYCPEGACKVVC